MRNNLLRKITILFIVILIPLIGSILIGIYAHNREVYQNEYISKYMLDIEEDTEVRILEYIKFITDSYEEDPYYQEDIMEDNELVLKLVIYRGIITQIANDEEEVEESNTNESTEGEQLFQYFIVMYNINWDKLVELRDPTGERTDLPLINIAFTDTNDSENEETISMGVPTEELGRYVWDYESTKEQEVVRYYAYQPSEDLPDEVSVDLFLTYPQDNDFRVVFNSFSLTEFENNIDNVDTSNFVEGYHNSIFKAGYFGYVFSRYIWWQSIIAFILVGFISFSFYAVWAAEETQKKVVKK